MKKIVALLFNLAVGIILSAMAGGGALAAVGIGAALSLVPRSMAGVLPMAIQVEIWENDIIEDLWASNKFLTFAYNADQFVLMGKVVHIPQAGAPAGTKVNRTDLPATVVRRTDVDITYAIDEITSDPVHLPNADTVELSYDKRRSITSQMRYSMYEVAALNMINRWAPETASRLLKTTGEAVPAHTDSATGDRKAIRLADIKKAQLQFNKENIPSGDRYLLIDADMMDQLTNEMSANQNRDFLAAYDEKNGVMGRIFGFNLIVRSQVARYTGSGSKKSWETGGSPTDCAAALAWHTQSVERALGDVKFFEDLGNPQYYGDIYSALIRLGGRIRRNDNKGVLAIVQDAVA